MVDHMRNWPQTGGKNIASDNIDGVHYQRVKVGHGADGTFNDTSDTDPLPVTVTGGGVPSALRSARASVAVPGTRQQLPGNPAAGITVRALAANLGTLYVGGPDVDATNGFPLSPGEGLNVELADTDLVYLDADQAGDGAAYVWVAP